MIRVGRRRNTQFSLGLACTTHKIRRIQATLSISATTSLRSLQPGDILPMSPRVRFLGRTSQRRSAGTSTRLVKLAVGTGTFSWCWTCTASLMGTMDVSSGQFHQLTLGRPVPKIFGLEIQCGTDELVSDNMLSALGTFSMHRC